MSKTLPKTHPNLYSGIRRREADSGAVDIKIEQRLAKTSSDA